MDYLGDGNQCLLPHHGGRDGFQDSDQSFGFQEDDLGDSCTYFQGWAGMAFPVSGWGTGKLTSGVRAFEYLDAGALCGELKGDIDALGES